MYVRGAIKKFSAWPPSSFRSIPTLQILNGTSAELGYKSAIHVGLHSKTQDRRRIKQTTHKLNTTQKKYKQRKTQQNKTSLV